MLSNDEIQQLRSENELLKLQLQDITEMINIREEELEILRKKSAYTVLLKSTLDGNLEEITQMQQFIGEQQRKVAGAAKREIAMENEIIQSLEMEKEFYTIREKYESARTAIKDLDNELADTTSMYRQLAASISRVAELESSLEMTLMENRHLKEEVEKYKSQIQETS
jgi:chromosome segregation ATPase